MEQPDEPPNFTGRIQYAENVETGPRSDRLARRDSDSTSITSLSSRRTVEPGNILPIQYRTISSNIEEGKSKEAESTDKLKTYIESSDIDWHTLSLRVIYQRLSTSSQQGLSEMQVACKLEEYGLTSLHCHHFDDFASLSAISLMTLDPFFASSAY